MNTQYTPGPWYATGVHVQSSSIDEDNYVCKAEGNFHEQEQANARLIAAAPELLEELQCCVKWLEHFSADVFTPQSIVDIRNDLKTAKLAIAKATGKDTP